MKAMFESAIECAWAVFGVFGPNAFRRWSSGDDRSPEGQRESKLNIALWDTVLYTFAFFEKRQIVPVADAIREEFLDLMSTDDTFVGQSRQRYVTRHRISVAPCEALRPPML